MSPADPRSNGANHMTPREQLAQQLKQARVDAGYKSQSSFARALHISRPVITRAENPGQPVPTSEVLEAYAGETGADLDELEDLAKRASGGTPLWFMPYLAAESSAVTLRCWSPVLMPGLLQTESYAHQLIATEPYTPEQLSELVRARIARQHVLNRAYVTAIIDSRVLSECMGSPTIMAEQCGHLVTRAELPNIAVHVVPAGRNTGLSGAFDIAASSTGLLTVRMTALRDVTSTAPDLADEAVRAFERYLGHAMGPDESLDFIRQREAEWKEQV